MKPNERLYEQQNLFILFHQMNIKKKKLKILVAMNNSSVKGVQNKYFI